ncbi:hypothetical protein RCL1_005965 [Eukaryota sp. TZLM3-RCL]
MMRSIVFVLLVSLALSKTIMPWMCLERCKEDIPADLKQIASLDDLLTDVSFEEFDLDWGARLKHNGFTKVSHFIEAHKLGTQPMITTVNIAKLTELFASTASMDFFIEQIVEVAKKNNYTGINIDFEPSGQEAFPLADGYVEFVDRLAKALHKFNKVCSIDIARWSQFWNYKKLAATEVDFFCEMSTYAGAMSNFKTALYNAMEYFGDRAVIGLISVNPNTGKLFTDQDMAERFALIREVGAKGIAIWQSPIPANFIPLLKEFKKW